MKVTVILIAIGALGTVPKILERGLEVLEIKDYLAYGIIKIG